MRAAPGVHAVVAGAGLGARFGAPKWSLPLRGRQVLDYALRPLALCYPEIQSITLLLPPEDLPRAAVQLPAGLEYFALAGGATRADSVMRGLESAQARAGGDARVLVHDVARPCVWRADVQKLLDCEDAQGCLLAVPVTDTVKLADSESRVDSSPPRQNLWRAQTPQLYPLATLHASLGAALREGVEVTDEARAMEHAGHHPRLLPGREDNIKLTWPEDLDRAERILQQDPDDAYWARL